MMEKDVKPPHGLDRDAYAEVELEKGQVTAEQSGGFKDFVVSTQT